MRIELQMLSAGSPRVKEPVNTAKRSSTNVSSTSLLTADQHLSYIIKIRRTLDTSRVDLGLPLLEKKPRK
jgi:hypothetical protein